MPQAMELEQLIQIMSKLPGLGARSARRAVLHLLKHKQSMMEPLAQKMLSVSQQIVGCDECGNWDVTSPCSLCADAARDHSTICVVEEVSDCWALERGRLYRGLYHILGGTLSAMDGRGPEQLNIPKLEQRITQLGVKEIILATNATVDGQTTAHYITERIKPLNIIITRLAMGIPMGGELDYLDEGTLSNALSTRQAV